MDSFLWAFSGSKNGGGFCGEFASASLGPNVFERLQFKDTFLDDDLVDEPVIHLTDLSKRLDRDSAEDHESSDAVLRYINEVLMDDDLEDETSLVQDSTLHAAESSLYEILIKKEPPPPHQSLPHENARSLIDNSRPHCCSNFSSSCSSANNFVESGIISGPLKYNSSHVHNPYIGYSIPTNSPLLCLLSCSSQTPGAKAFSESQSSWRFNRLIEEKGKVGRKSAHREESDLEEGRSKKQLAVYNESSFLHELFDKVLSLYDEYDESALSTCDLALPVGTNGETQRNEFVKDFIAEITYTKKHVRRKGAIDTRSVLIQCMQSVAGNDHMSASKLLRQIRLRSSPCGDGSQRLAHYFANALEARLLGGGKCRSFASNVSDSAVLKAQKLYLSAFPFYETSYFFADRIIMKLAEKATSIHIIHFGIVYGLQWPLLIQRLSTRPGGPPKLRITGIDLPQFGFRPAARVKETGERLANYCKKYNVPFEYDGIAQEWETVSVEDLKIEKDEALVVNCLYLLMMIHDDSVMEHSRRDAVLNLIKRINPDIFIHGVLNGNLSSPFFDSRFRETLFHFSALFDMFEAHTPYDSEERIGVERDILGNQILNLIACEGVERLLRPEMYKQWQIRTLRAGFRQLPLDQEIMTELRAKMKSCHHKNFFVDEASQWMLAGWKSRAVVAVSCWKPAKESAKSL